MKHRGIAYFLQSWLLRYVWAYPGRLKMLFTAARIFRDLKLPSFIRRTRILSLLWPRAAFGLALLEASTPARLTFTKNREVELTKSVALRENPQPSMLFKGCVTEGLFRRVNDATKRVLRVNSFEPQCPANQVCCGALHAHSGDLAGARELARRNIDAFVSESEIPIITNAGGCGAMLSNYGHLLVEDTDYAERARSFSSRIRDVSQVLSNDQLPKDTCKNLEPTAYDASCHLLYGQHAADASLRMLLSAPGVNYVPLSGSEVCCGGAGIYNLLEPELSSQVLREKLTSIENSGARVVATGNPGCHMQIRAGSITANKLELKVFHPVEILDESYRCAGLYAKSGF
jgi:glycolate oxidase iron-sulfur subunit